ncbi:MAG: glycerol-3-phosphate 1-O-acyltransferase PlsY [Alphaproteobacteria bacterium]|jgi:glycerol-3-phosphate acyltransferase PlsY|uniref:Glycerol-3-phosphate acyltransferase n=1 Tax=Peteryoungia algae TaxID=2919917 RepID=A0ABT0D2A4_9HYPH|nr:glycerol-3-phosphate 1-O-acyltransferase PlsY [Rhizobium sp. SSM4.3]MBU2327417.1 glycerol-3-phosphate 1-O-acyltransferase PlsY [Alphaproteobacteria bacterium]MCJ8239535.1 glycerol-3-phosphate 1-O-acyltransferase PlsY [Rhizobium sp. SSM4.3]
MPIVDYSALGFPNLAIVLVLGYLLGSIPFGLLLTKMAGLGDLRSIGSGNIGATNVLRTGNKKLAAATLLLDALKATAAALIAQAVFGHNAGLFAGFAAFIGHLFPVWLGFKGGKGVATYIGTLLGVAPLMVLVFAVVWLSVAFLTRYSSLSALVATLVIPVVLWILGVEETALVTAAMTAITFWRHKANIQRLVAGTEGKIGQKG